MNLVIRKSARTLTLLDEGRELLTCAVGLGRSPAGPKQAEGDGRTPEGEYFICLIKEQGKYGRSLGLSYPGPADARSAFNQGRIDEGTLRTILLAHAEKRRPPWGSPMGGEIYIHEGGSLTDWTQGCIALNTEDMDQLFPFRDRIDTVEILP